VARLHHHEKEIVGFEAQLSRVAVDEQRLGRKAGLLAVERARAEEEGGQLDRRQAEVRESISRIEAQQREADARFNAAQRQLFAVREKVDALGYRVSEAKATHAALIERAAALVTEVSRLEDAASDLEKRISELRAERTQKSSTRNDLLAAVAGGLKTLDEDVHALERERQAVREAEVVVAQHHTQADLNEHELRTARATLDGERAHAGDVEVARATAEADLTHLAGLCSESLQMSLDDVLADVDRLEREGGTVADAQTLATEDPEESPDEPTELGTDGEPALSSVEGTAPHEATAPVPSAGLTAEQAITVLRARIDRLGPVNMMAIEQFDELETRHGFLTTQRKDLVDSIAQTGEAITRIDETSKVRFREAFSAISQNFQKTFSALFGGGRAGLTLLDDLDPLESGIDIVASPPGKRLQSVQLLSGGEKALTAIALMFAIFQYKPSPFCLLDEIDAPLDDANIGRFVEMLKGMLDRTQFILITHNRKTMEIADRLYGVTMEEPGVSKLISVRLN
jgi:chromosome segregation protein